LAKNAMVLSVEGMSCNHCKASVEKALKTLEGVEKAQVDLQKAQVEVEFDPEKISEEDLRGAVTAAGYQVL
jgi:copper chaperone